MSAFARRAPRCFWRSFSHGLLLLISAFSLDRAAGDTGQGATSSQIDNIKNAFVVNIARFAHWPQQNAAAGNSPLRLCMYRSAEADQQPKALQQMIAGRPVDVTHIDRLNSPEDCSVLVVPGGEIDHFRANFLPLWRHQPILTILDLTTSTQGGKAYSGIMVALVRKGSKIGFEINLDEVHGAGLKMSSELLKLATLVKGDN
ncbi:MAG: YfiR family protein [Porticoccaceae bacterium]|nr:YfiR family protein [Porticoccaceae bacterium]